MTDGTHDLDDVDARILAGIDDAFAVLDPPPADLDERVIVTLATAGLDAELVHLVEDTVVRPAARATGRVRTVRFAGSGVEVLLQVVASGTGSVRVDGWLVPARAAVVELRTRDDVATATADDAGRFAFPEVSSASAQLVVRHEDAVVVTTAIRL